MSQRRVTGLKEWCAHSVGPGHRSHALDSIRPNWGQHEICFGSSGSGLSLRDPACHFQPDPDPTFHFDADPDPSFQIKAKNFEKVLIFQTSWLSSANLSGSWSGSSLSHWCDADPLPAYHFDADPDPTFQFDANPCGSGSATLPTMTNDQGCRSGY